MASSRGWPVITPGSSRGHDNVHVVAPHEDGSWRVGYRERGQDDWWGASFTEAEASRFVWRALLQHRARHELVDPELSSALVAYLGFGAADRPRRDAQAARAATTTDPAGLLARVEEIVHETLAVEPDWEPRVGDPVDLVAGVMRSRHPELDAHAVDALAWLYLYDWS